MGQVNGWPGRATQVLLVEDNPGDARLIRELLAVPSGRLPRLELQQVGRLDQALEWLDRGGVDLVLLDLGLPDSQGFDTFAAVHARLAQTPVIVLTGSGDEELALRAVAKGAQDYLVKGRDDDQALWRSICYALGRARAERQAYDSTIEAWSRALDLRDHETEGHSRRVAEATVWLARQLGLRESELTHLRRGALLHDIGKVGIPDAILLKPGPLSADEWLVMKRHPQLAYELLSPIEYLRPALDIPYCHHEKWDGSGYPGGLAGPAIPLAARIFAVVDVWDALRSERPYRPAWPEHQARQQIATLVGTHFDPQVGQAFLAMSALGMFAATIATAATTTAAAGTASAATTTAAATAATAAREVELAEPPQPRCSETETARPLLGASVLVVEDNPAELRLLRELWAEARVEGATITTVGRLDAALELLAGQRFGLVLLDLGLPDSVGMDTLLRLRQQEARVPVVVFTGLDDEAIGVRAILAGAQDYLVKDQVTSTVLARTVRFAIERERLRQSLLELTWIDELTRINNRRGFFLLAEDQLKLARRCGVPVSLLFADLDNLKGINDRFGHAAGDAALRHAAQVLRAAFRGSDVIGRIGGDEFAVLALDAAPGLDQVMVRRLQELLESCDRLPDLPFALRLSLGTARLEANGSTSLEELIEAADRLMYADKDRRRQAGRVAISASPAEPTGT